MFVWVWHRLVGRAGLDSQGLALVGAEVGRPRGQTRTAGRVRASRAQGLD